MIQLSVALASKGKPITTRVAVDVVRVEEAAPGHLRIYARPCEVTVRRRAVADELVWYLNGAQVTTAPIAPVRLASGQVSELRWSNGPAIELRTG